jgi:hypothetical protein
MIADHETGALLGLKTLESCSLSHIKSRGKAMIDPVKDNQNDEPAVNIFHAKEI